jgi:PAS domain S-box-containing protein
MEHDTRSKNVDAARTAPCTVIEQAKQEWEATIDALPQLVCLINDQGSILRANRAVEGWQLGQVTTIKGRAVHALFHPGCAVPACPLEHFWHQAWENLAHGHTSVWEAEDARLRRYLRMEVRPLGEHAKRAGRQHTSAAVVVVHDITQNKRIEAALQESEAQYRHLVEDGQGLICIHDLDGVLLSVNPAAAQRLGYQPHEGVGRNLREFLVPSIRDQFDAYLERIRRQPKDNGYLRLVTKTGEERVWLYCNVRCEPAGKPPYVLGHAQDITELTLAQKRLRESEERFRNLLEGSIQGVLIHRYCKPLFVNQAYATMHGYDTPDDIVKLGTYMPLLAAHERERLQHYNKMCLQGGDAPSQYEYQGLHQDGSVIWLENKVKTVQWGSEPAVQSTVFDITARKLAEAQLQEAYAHMQKDNQDLLSIINQLRAGVAVLDHTGQVTFLNESCQGWLGKSLAEVVGQHWTQVFAFEGADETTLKVLLTLPLPQSRAFSGRLMGPGSRRYWVDIDARADPRDPQRTLLFLYDRSEVHDLRRFLDDQARFHTLVGKSDPMLRVYSLIHAVAPTETTVLIDGETGTGKERVARAIHATSRRQAHPFIAVNCAELSESLLGSQLFGHKRGAFTGAIADRQGLFEAANGGTVFLDEIGDMPLPVQTMLLRVLQEREITRLGESKPRQINVRILVATQHDLHDAVTRGAFRADLLYRIRVARVHLPALRERREDIPLLVSEFLSASGIASEHPVPEVSREAMRLLLEYPWPGNIRELRNAIEFAMICCRGSVIQPEDLPPELVYGTPQRRASDLYAHDEQQHLLKALQATHGNRAAAARRLGIGRSTFYRRLSEHGIASTPSPAARRSRLQR